jgi:hypothetical protein
VPDFASGKKAMWDRKNARPWVTQPDLTTKYQGIVAAKHDRLSRADWRDEGDLRRWAEDNHKALFLVEKDLRWPPRQGARYDDDVADWNREAENSNREWNATSRRYKRAHRKLISNNYLVGRPIYGYRAMGVNCQQTPCRCFEQGKDDNKTLAIYEPEAKVIRELVTRYLAGETLQALCDDLYARHIPSPKYGQSGNRWYTQTLARLLRNPGLAGRRENAEGKTVLRYKGIITWQAHQQLVAQLDSKAHRKGISPANTYMLTGILSDEAGHAMYGIKAGERSNVYYYYCRKGCGLMVRVDQADPEVSEAVTEDYGERPHRVKRIIPGKNHFEEIARLRQDRSELDDMANDYDERHAAITAEIRRLTRLDAEHPEPDRVGWVNTDKTIAQHWESLGTAGRRDWLRESGWKVTAIKDYEMPHGWRLSIDAGEAGRDAMSFGLESPEEIARDAFALADALKRATDDVDS